SSHALWVRKSAASRRRLSCVFSRDHSPRLQCSAPRRASSISARSSVCCCKSVVRISFNVMGTSRRGDSSVAEQVAGRKRGPGVHSCSAPTCRLIEFWSISPSRVQCSASSTPDKRSTARDRHTRGRRRPYRKNQLESGERPMLDQFSRFTFALLLASL